MTIDELTTLFIEATQPKRPGLIQALILPPGLLSEETVDSVVKAALDSGLVVCNPMTGQHRIGFFPADRVPRGWARIGVTHRPTTPEPTPCAA